MNIQGNDLSLLTKEQIAAIISLLTDALAEDLKRQVFLHQVVKLVCDLTFASGAVAEQIIGDKMVYIGVTDNIADNLGLRLQANNSLSGMCVREKTTLVCQDTENDPRVDAEACRKIGIRSMIVTPLFKGDTIFGVIKVFSSQTDTFDDVDKQILEVSAQILSRALVPCWPGD